MSQSFTVVGDAMVDVTARIQAAINHASDTPAKISMLVGGAGVNTARWLAYLGHQTTFVGAVGDDPIGALIADDLRACGVEAQLQVVHGVTTGTCIVLITPDGERTMLPDAGANGELDSTRVHAQDLDGHLHLSGYTLLNPASADAGLAILRMARETGCTVSLDPASAAPLAQFRTLMDTALRDVDVVIANLDEARVLTGLADPVEALTRLASLVPTAVIKLGADGAIAMRDGALARVAAVPAEPIDTTGAGDAFAAGFLPAWRDGADLTACLNSGAQAAAGVVGRVGAGPPPLAP